jgi:YesN/AraC family two-component response regulator
MKILLVDDEDVMRQYLRRVLQQEPSWQIVEARDGQEAWELLQQDPLPDLCLLDIMMPRMNGLELLEKMRDQERFLRVKVIMCTVVRDADHVQAAISLDVSDYILKPFKNLTLLNMVRRALGVAPHAMPEIAKDQQTPSILEESYPQRLVNFLRVSTQNLAEIEALLAQGRPQTILERVEILKADSRALGLNAMEQAASALEFALASRDQAEIQARLQTVRAMNCGIAEVMEKLATYLDPQREAALA